MEIKRNASVCETELNVCSSLSPRAQMSVCLEELFLLLREQLAEAQSPVIPFHLMVHYTSLSKKEEIRCSYPWWSHSLENLMAVK